MAEAGEATMAEPKEVDLLDRPVALWVAGLLETAVAWEECSGVVRAEATWEE